MRRQNTIMTTKKIISGRQHRSLLALAATLSGLVFFAGCDRTAQEATAAYGKGDYKTAYAAYSKLAKAGQPDAQFTLGLMYFEGTGPDKDFAEAVRWYRRAANQGQVMAQNNLGAMYMEGKGVQQDFAEAAFWFTLVANAGDTHAKQLRDTLAIRLTAAEQDAVRGRVQNWKPLQE